MGSEDVLDVFLREELRIANRHAPRSRPSVCELMRMEVPFVHTADGGVHMMNPREVALLHEVARGDCGLRLPIVLEYVPEGEGMYVVEDPASAEVVARVLGLSSWTAPLVLHRPHVLELRRTLRTTTVILLSPRVLKPDTWWSGGER